MIKQTSSQIYCYICCMGQRIFPESLPEEITGFYRDHEKCSQKEEEKKQAEKDILYSQLISFHTLNLARPGRWDT